MRVLFDTNVVLDLLLDRAPFAASAAEDAVLHEAGREFGATAIATRNQRDFDGGSLAIYEPAELFLALTSAEADTL